MKKALIFGFGGQGKQLLRVMNGLGIEVAVCDTDPAKFGPQTPTTKESWARSFPDLVECGPIPKIYTNWQACLKENPGVDIVAVATWTKNHEPVAIEAAKSGARAILCEEPMATSLYGARRIIGACADNNVLLTVHHTRRWWPAHQEIRKLIQEGTIGDLRHISISCGGARVSDLGTHWIDFARWITDAEVNSVTGWLYPIEEPNPRGPQFKDYPAEILINFDNDVKTFINEGPGIVTPLHYEIVGTRGLITNDQVGRSENWVVKMRSGKNLSPVRDYYGEMEEVRISAPQDLRMEEWGRVAVLQLLEGKTTFCGGKDGYETLEVLIAAHVSHRERNMPIKLPLVDPQDLAYKMKSA